MARRHPRCLPFTVGRARCARRRAPDVRTVVIGAGLGGLSAACHLVGAGHDVTVLERGAQPGGLAGRWCAQGYRFDTGPTVLTMPDILASTFEAAGATLE